MPEINFLKNYPQTKRNVDERGSEKTEADRAVARQFGKDYFDGDRRFGYGGYSYQPRFWQPVMPDFKRHYKLSSKSSILDVGCGKGFMLYDFLQLIPRINIRGVDISQYALEHAKPEVKHFLEIGNAKKLNFPDGTFDLVISINTVHNLKLEDCKEALREIQRVSRGNAFVTVDAYRTDEEKKRMDKWNLTALTYMHVEEWKKLFEEAGYKGDYFWFIP